MLKLTQTSLYPKGNCWQTAVACLLDIPAEQLPSQADSYYSKIDRDSGETTWHMNYNNRLQAYLKKHHKLAYIELWQPQETLSQLRIVGYHLMSGTTVRSAAYGGQRHIVVGYEGKVFWDPHPSQAGLLDEIRWAVLCPFPPSWERYQNDACECPACVGEPKQ